MAGSTSPHLSRIEHKLSSIAGLDVTADPVPEVVNVLHEMLEYLKEIDAKLTNVSRGDERE